MCLYFVYFFFSSRRRHTRCALVTGVQTCALPISSEVWFYEHPYPEGYKSYSKTKPLRIEEFRGEDSEQAWWGDIKTRADREENDRAWKVSAEEIKARGYNLDIRSEEHTSELQSLMRISYAVFCLKKKQKIQHTALQHTPCNYLDAQNEHN